MTKLEKQMDRFIKSDFKKALFTNDLYDMLYIHSNYFIAHFNKDGFYRMRFQKEADKTIVLLNLVKKPELKIMCEKLAKAMSRQIHQIETIVYSNSVIKE